MYKGKITGSIKILFACVVLVTSVFIIGCKDSVNAPNLSTSSQSNLSTAEKQAITQMAEQDSAVASFDPSFNESQSDSYLGKTDAAITPYFVWQHVILTNKAYSFTTVGDSAYLKVTKTYQGVLNIAASTQGGGTSPDTIITKNFTSVLNRQLLFVKIDSTDNPMLNWKLAGISLVSGGAGTSSGNFNINSLTLTLSSGDTVTITDPQNFFIARSYLWNRWHSCPQYNANDSVKVSVEVYSAYADTDFVTITYGADSYEQHRDKVKLDLVSQMPSGSGYVRVFERTFKLRNYRGYFSAVLNAFTRQTIYDDSAPVESNTWGLPYKVR